MLIDFVIKNYLSFRDEKVFSMLCPPNVEAGKGTITFGDKQYSSLSAIYGANASGKTNLINAMGFFRNMVLNSYGNDNILYGIYHQRFLFANNNDIISMEITIKVGENIYRYGFEINTTTETVESEWLFVRQSGAIRESYCFKRYDGDILCNSKIFKVRKKDIESTRNNTLFLTKAALDNEPTAKAIKDWFEYSFNIISGMLVNTIMYTAGKYMNDEEMSKAIRYFMQNADFGIDDIRVEEQTQKIRTEQGKVEEQKVLSIETLHTSDNGNVYMPLATESLGTQKIFALLGPWIDSLKNGKTLVVDEYGAGIHTHLAKQMLELWQSPSNNGGQLIINTHDTNLLRKDLLRRDQIWFTEKDKTGATDLYSLLEYKIDQTRTVRGDASFGKDYLAGKYGAIPYFGNIDKFVTDYDSEEEN